MYTFLELYTTHRFGIPELAQQTGIPQSTFRLMLNYQPVFRRIAYKVLAELSTQLHQEYTLESTDIPLIPNFSQTLGILDIVPGELAENAGVTTNTVLLMIADKPVFQQYAEKVLSALSAMTQQSYSLENVDVNILMIISDQSEVANLMQRIEAEYVAGKQGLEGLAEGTAKHEVITKRLENIATHHAALLALVGDETTNQLMDQVGG